MPAGPSDRAPRLLLAWLVLDFSFGIYLFLDGVSSLSRVTLIAGFALLFLALLARRRQRPVTARGLEVALLAILVVELVARLVVPYRPEDPPVQIPIGPLALVALLATAIVAWGRVHAAGRAIGPPAWLDGAALAAVLGTAVAARVLIVGFDIEATFDVHLIQEAAGRAVLEGTNPYHTYVYYAGYPYWPLAALTAAGGVLFGDARWLLVVADALLPLAFVGVARNVGLPVRLGLLAAALFLWDSSGLYVIWQGLPEPALIAFLGLAVVAATSTGRARYVAGIGLGLAIGVKQLALGMLPALVLWRRRWGLATFAVAAAVALVLVAIGALPDPQAFVQGSILAHLVEPAREYAVNLLDPLPGVIPRFTVPFVVSAALAGLAALAVRLRWADPIAGWLAASIAVLMVLFGLTGISFVNYYQIVLALILMLVLIPERPPQDTPRPVQGSPLRSPEGT